MAWVFPSNVDGPAAEVQRRVMQAFLSLPKATDRDADSTGVAKELQNLINDIEKLITTRHERPEAEWLADAVNILEKALLWIVVVAMAVLAAVIPAEILRQPVSVEAEAVKAAISSAVTTVALHAQRLFPLLWRGPDMASLLKEDSVTLAEARAALREGGSRPAGPHEAQVVGRKRLC